MVIVAGPAGGGKSSLFPVTKMAGLDPFSNDDYCAHLNAIRLGRAEPVYTGITPELRQQGGAVMQAFIEGHIAARKSFAFETTLRELTFEQARRARANGFRVEMIFVAAGPVEVHIGRVKARADFGGHSASEASLREIYARGMRLLVTAFEENRRGNIEILAVFHNPPATRQADLTPARPSLVVEMVRGVPAQVLDQAPAWFDQAVRGSEFEFTRLQDRARFDLER